MSLFGWYTAALRSVKPRAYLTTLKCTNALPSHHLLCDIKPQFQGWRMEPPLDTCSLLLLTTT